MTNATRLLWQLEGSGRYARGVISACRLLLRHALAAGILLQATAPAPPSLADAQARLQASVKELPPSLEPFRDEIQRAKEDYDYGEHLSTRARHQGTVSDELVRTLAISGTVDECVARTRALMETGVDDLIFPLLGGGRLERLEVLTERIAPEVVS